MLFKFSNLGEFLVNTEKLFATCTGIVFVTMSRHNEVKSELQLNWQTQ